MKFLVSKQVSQFDEDIDVIAIGLPVGKVVRIVLTCLHKSAAYESWARFRVGDDGNVDFSRDPPLTGTYWGIDKMGLFSSMCPVPNSRLGTVMSFNNASDILLPYQLTAYAGREILGQCTILKRIVDPSVERIEVNEGNLRGVLFKPRTNKVHKAVIDMYGIGGRCRVHRAALLAQKGFAVLALGLYNYKDRPKSLHDVDLSYLKEAIEWITNLPFTSDECVLLGHSFGGYVAFLAALNYPKISSVIAIAAPAFTPPGISILIDGKRLPNIFQLTEEHESYRKYLRNEMISLTMWNHVMDTESAAMEHSYLPMERVPEKVAFMLVAGEQDLTMPAVRWARDLERRLRRATKRRVDTAYLKHSGHMIEPPNMPHYATVFSPPVCCAQGGDQYLQCVEQRELWPKIQRFIETTVERRDERAKI